MIWIHIAFGALIIFLFVVAASAIYHIFRSVPYVPSNARVLEQMIRLARLKPGAVVYDLGAGDGRILRAALKVCPQIHARAVEIAPAVYLYGRLRSLIARQKIQWKLGSLYNQDLRDADLIFLYLFPHMLTRLESKLDQELKPGTQVISHAFIFPNKEPVESVKLTQGRITRTVHVYEW